MNSEASASAAPIGPALVNTMIPTLASGSIWKLVAAPRTNAPEWLRLTRPLGCMLTLKPNPDWAGRWAGAVVCAEIICALMAGSRALDR